MWTPNKKGKNWLDDWGRFCHTEAKNCKGEHKGLLEEAKEPTEVALTYILVNQKEEPHEESKQADSSLNQRKTIKPIRAKRETDLLKLESDGKAMTFEVFMDREIGLKDIAEDLVATTMDDDTATTSEVMHRAQKECMRDLYDAVNFRKELDGDVSSSQKESETDGKASLGI